MFPTLSRAEHSRPFYYLRSSYFLFLLKFEITRSPGDRVFFFCQTYLRIGEGKKVANSSYFLPLGNPGDLWREDRAVGTSCWNHLARYLICVNLRSFISGVHFAVVLLRSLALDKGDRVAIVIELVQNGLGRLVDLYTLNTYCVAMRMGIAWQVFFIHLKNEI